MPAELNENERNPVGSELRLNAIGGQHEPRCVEVSEVSEEIHDSQRHTSVSLQVMSGRTGRWASAKGTPA